MIITLGQSQPQVLRLQASGFLRGLVGNIRSKAPKKRSVEYDYEHLISIQALVYARSDIVEQTTPGFATET